MFHTQKTEHHFQPVSSPQSTNVLATIMPYQSTPPSFHEGCYCFRDAEAEAARASGLPVRCGGGQPCNCVTPLPTADDALWDSIVGDVVSRGSKRPRSQCASCSCACAILHAASAAATAAAAKIRRCCGGDCRCPAGMCRCPQEAVEIDTYACGALNDYISQRVSSALQMDPQSQPQPQPPETQANTHPQASSDVSATLQALQIPSTGGVEIANALYAALQGFPWLANMQQTHPLQHVQPVQTARTGCCASSDFTAQRQQPLQQQLPDDLTNGISPLQPIHTSRTCCGGASVKQQQPEANGIAPATEAITTHDLAAEVPAIPALTPPGRQVCCGPPSSAPLLHTTALPEVLDTTQLGDDSSRLTAKGLASGTPPCCGAPSSEPLLHTTALSEVLVTTQPGDDSSRLSAKGLPSGTPQSLSTNAVPESVPESAPSTRSDSSQRSGEPDRQFECNLCDANFKFKQNRDRHINEVHRGLRPHECDYPRCKRAFKNLSGLKQHKKTVHEKARPFKCELCDRAFGQRNHLSQHVLVVHDKVKRYPCNYCDMAFSNVGNRTQHTKRRHPDELQRKEDEPPPLNESTT